MPSPWITGGEPRVYREAASVIARMVCSLVESGVSIDSILAALKSDARLYDDVSGIICRFEPEELDAFSRGGCSQAIRVLVDSLCGVEVRVEDWDSVSTNIEDVAVKMGIDKRDVSRVIFESGDLRSMLSGVAAEIAVDEYRRQFIDALRASNCATTYCLLMKLTTVWDKMHDFAQISGIDARRMLREMLMHDDVMNFVARRFKPDDILEEARKVQFKSIHPVLDVIEEWVEKLREERRRLLKEQKASRRRARVRTAANVTSSTHPERQSGVAEVELSADTRRRSGAQGGRVGRILVPVLLALAGAALLAILVLMGG